MIEKITELSRLINRIFKYLATGAGVVFALIVSIIGVLYLVDDISQYTLGYETEDSGMILTEGWNIFWEGWFFFIPGILLSFIVMMVINLFFYAKGVQSHWKQLYEDEKEAHRRIRTQLTSQASFYKKQAENAYESAIDDLSESFDELRKQQVQVQNDIEHAKTIKKDAQAQLAQAEAIKAVAKKIESDARQSVRESSQKLRRDQKKKNNATAALQRKKRALAKLQASEKA